MNEIPETEVVVSVMPGEWLQQARLKSEMTVEQVATALNIDQRKVEAIEASQFIQLGAPVYVKGYLRKFARLVNVPEEALLERYDNFEGAAPEVVPVPVSHNMIPDRHPIMSRRRWTFLWTVVLFCIAATLYGVFQPRKADITNTNQVGSTNLQVETIPVSPLQSLPAPSTAESSSSLSTNTAVMVSMKFSFIEDSWVEVLDASKQQVIYENVRAGEARTIRAAAPLQVTLGSVSAVNIEVNDKSVVVPLARVNNKPAQFVVTDTGLLE